MECGERSKLLTTRIKERKWRIVLALAGVVVVGCVLFELLGNRVGRPLVATVFPFHKPLPGLSLDNAPLIGLHGLVALSIVLVARWLFFTRKSPGEQVEKTTPALAFIFIGQVLFVWLLVSLKLFAFRSLGNEIDVLPSAKQFVQPGWLPNDWYLNLDIGYRNVFNSMQGNLIAWLGFENGAYVGRLTVYLLFATAIVFFFRTIKLRMIVGAFVLLVFLRYQSLVAGEWMVLGVDTKTISYSFVLLALSFFLRKKYYAGFACAGAAVSFHILVGGYASLCLAVAALSNQAWRSEWRVHLKRCWPYFITGAIGLLAIANQLFASGAADASAAWNVYVQYRVPHHVLPSAWGSGWIVRFTLCLVLFGAIFKWVKPGAARFLAAFALGSALLFVCGLVIDAVGPPHLLRYYWFRFPDVILPFLSFVFCGLALDALISRAHTLRQLPPKLKGLVNLTQEHVVPVVLTTVLALMVYRSLGKQVFNYTLLREEIPSKQAEAFAWIKANTPRDASFLIDPTIEGFYLQSQRAKFVSLKHSPQSADHILEWYKRIKMINNGSDLAGIDDKTIAQLTANYHALSESEIQQIAKTYGIDHVLTDTNQTWSFEPVYRNEDYVVYQLPAAAP